MRTPLAPVEARAAEHAPSRRRRCAERVEKTLALLGDLDPSVADPMTLFDVRPQCGVAVVHGIDDEDVPVSLSRGLAERHPWVDLHVVPGGHMDLVEPGSVAWPTVLEVLGAG